MKTDPANNLIKDPDPALTAMENALKYAELNLRSMNEHIQNLQFELINARKKQSILNNEFKQLKRSIKIWTGEAL